ncbi:MAG: prepilin-type N-terminal cleavage/methylation domain-containing protein [Sedimentisphaerales bacterium]|nr:prepilin-type N-terminal cleavage/methylation domain-containing protein [Sedimentisphaerales bacterium]
MAPESKKGFALVELLVVIAIIALLMSILVPALASARSGARKLVCKSNIRQLLLANIAYAGENDGFYVAAASDMGDSPGLHRWHGVREGLGKPFEPKRGPLAGYLADGEVKECPERVNFVKSDDWNTSFELGCGGYGYNMTYIGSRMWQNGLDSPDAFKAAYVRTTRATEVANPAQTLMFADTAMSNDGRSYIEDSFAWQPYTVYAGRVMTGLYTSPSIHFRHRGRANVGWVGGHVEEKQMADCQQMSVYGVDSAAMNLGWFEPVDNTLFDLE